MGAASMSQTQVCVQHSGLTIEYAGTLQAAKQYA